MNRGLWSFFGKNVYSDAITARADHDAPRLFALSIVLFAANETASITATDIIGVVSVVVAAIIISGSAWAFKKINKRHAVATGDKDVPADDTPNHQYPAP